MAFKMSKEFKVGLFALVTATVLYLGFNFLKGSDFLSSTTRIHAIYEDVGGLVISNPVLINGLAVGRIQDINLDPSNAYRAIVTMEIKSRVPVYKGVTSTLVSTDFLGGKAIRLNLPAIRQTLITEDDTIPAEIEKGMIEEVTAKVAPMLANLDSVSNEIKVLLRTFRYTSKSVDGTLLSFKGTADKLGSVVDANAPNLAAITQNASRLAASLVGTEQGLKQMVGKFNQLGDTLTALQIGQTVNSLNKSVAGLNTIMSDVNSGRGTLGKLAKNDSLYRNLNNSSASLDALLQDLKAKPARYVHFSLFGRKQK